jgi:hypothetical protein
MFKILDGSEGDVLGVEISERYTKDDVEQLKKAFEAILAAGNERVNVLAKIDSLGLTKIDMGAFIDDSRFALGHMKQLRHIAVVGNSGLQKILVQADNLILGKPEEELIEKYFDAADIDQAWAFVRG